MKDRIARDPRLLYTPEAAMEDIGCGNTASKCGLLSCFFPCLQRSLVVSSASAQTGPRARDLGVPFDGTPGPFNAITDVKGVEVGHTHFDFR